MTIREAVQSDNEELLGLIRETPMSGRIQLRIDREPNFFGLVSLRGTGRTVVAEDKSGLVACFSVTEKPAFVGGAKSCAGYLADLRIRPTSRGKYWAYRMAKSSLEYAAKSDCDLFYMVVSEGNDEMLTMVTGRADLPTLIPLGSFDVFSILPKRKWKCPPLYSLFKVEDLSTAAEAANFFNHQNSSFLFAPVVDPESLVDDSASRNLTKLAYVAKCKDRIVAAAVMADLSAFKSNTVLKLPLHLRITLAILRVLKPFLPIPKMPQIGEAIAIMFIKNFAVEPGHEEALRAIVSQMRKDVFERSYSFLSVGVHEKDPRHGVFDRMLRFNYKSLLYVIPPRPESNQKVSESDIPMVDFSIG